MVRRLAAGLAVVAGCVLAVAPAAANPPAPPGVLTVGSLQRTYVLHVPPGLQRPNGLVINLHGSGQSGAVQAALTNYNAVADTHGFLVAYPDGIDQSWADGRGASVPDRQGVDDVGFLAALADRLSRDFAIPPGRVFVTGMSAGAFMANRFGCDRADLVTAIAPVAGTLGAGVPCAPSRPVSVLQIQGTADPVVPFGGGPMVGRGGPSEIVSAPALTEMWRRLSGCPAPFAEQPPAGPVRVSTSAGCAGGAEVALVQVEGGAHVWPADASMATGRFFAAR